MTTYLPFGDSTNAPPMLVSQSSQLTRSYRILEAKYGSGLGQRAGDGINNIQDSWAITYDNLTASQYSTLIAAFDAAYGVQYFTWTPPNESTAKKFTVGQVAVQVKAGFIYSVQCVLTQQFDAT